MSVRRTDGLCSTFPNAQRHTPCTAIIFTCFCADAVRGENLRFFPELRHRVAKMLRVLAYDSGGAALPELLRPGM